MYKLNIDKLKILIAKTLAFFMRLFHIKFPTLADQIEKFIKNEVKNGGTDFVPEVFPMDHEGRSGWAITCVFTDKNGEKKCMRHLFIPNIEHVNEVKQMMLEAISRLYRGDLSLPLVESDLSK